MCMTPVLTLFYIVIIEVYLQCSTESVSLRDIGKPASRAEISSPSSIYLKAVKGARLGSASKVLQLCNYHCTLVLDVLRSGIILSVL